MGPILNCCFIELDIIEFDMFCQLDWGFIKLKELVCCWLSVSLMKSLEAEICARLQQLDLFNERGLAGRGTKNGPGIYHQHSVATGHPPVTCGVCISDQ